MTNRRFGARWTTLLITIVVLAVLAPGGASAIVGKTTTYLGRLYAGDGRDANEAYLDNPGGFIVDSSGNFFIADTFNNVVRRIEGMTNVITTFAGSGQMGLRNGAKKSASFRLPEGVAVAADGTVYVADTGNGRIREIRSGVVTTWPNVLRSPNGLVLDDTNLYVAEMGRDRVVKIDLATHALTAVASLPSPRKLAKLGDKLYVVSHGQTRITEIDLTTGTQRNVAKGLRDASGVTTYNGKIYFTAGANGIYNEIYRFDPSTRKVKRFVRRLETEWLNYASDIGFKGGVMYVLHSKGSSLFRMDANALNPEKVAGKHRYGQEFGSPSALLLGKPKALAVTRDGNTIYFSQNHQFAAFDVLQKQFRFLSGHANDNYKETVHGRERTSQPIALALSKDEQAVFFVDRNNHRVRKLDVVSGQLSYLTGAGGVNGDATSKKNGYREGRPCFDEFRTGVAGCAYFDRPSGLAISKDGKTLYVADTNNNRVRTVNVATGTTRLLAGSGVAGRRDGIGSSAQFSSPYGLALSKGGGTLYVVDRGNHAIRSINLSTKRVTTIVGRGYAGYREGAFRLALLSFPEGIVVGPDGNLYVSETGTQRIRVLDLRRKTTRLLAGSGQKGSQNGAGRVASFFNPRGLAFLGTNLLVADSTNDLIRKIETR